MAPGELDQVHTKLDTLLSRTERTENRLTVIETRFDVWRQAVIPMSTGFVGVVAGVILAVVALRG